MSESSDAGPLTTRSEGIADRFFQASLTNEEHVEQKVPHPDATADAATSPPSETAPEPDAPAPAASRLRDDRGRFASAPAETPDATPEPTEAPDSEQTTEAPVGDPEPTEEPTPAEATPEGPSMLDHVAREYDVSPDDFLDIVHIERDGQAVPLREALEAAPLPNGVDPEAYQAEVNEFRAARDQWAQQAQTERQQHLQATEELGKTLAGLNAMLQSGPSDADLERMKGEDPERYYETRAQKLELQQAIQAGIGELERNAQIQAQSRQQDTAALIQQEAQALIQKVPEWRDQGKREKGMSEVRNSLIESGWAPSEVDSIYDHKIILLAQKAMEFDRLKAAAPRKRAELKRLPKLTKPAAHEPAPSPEKQRVLGARRALSESGGLNRDAAHELFTNLVRGE